MKNTSMVTAHRLLNRASTNDMLERKKTGERV